MSLSNQRPVRWALIADDLTGAADAAVEFREAGFSTSVCLTPEAVEQCAVEICATTTETRELAEDEARREVRRWAEILKGAGRIVVFKKIDSLLRGPVAAETEELVRACGLERAAVCPALPRLGRACRGGVLRTQDGRDVPLPQSELLTAPDAESDEDLAHLVEELLQADGAVLPAGSSGLAKPWARALARLHGKTSSARHWTVPRKPVLCVVGSVHPRTQEQLGYATAQGIVERTDLRFAADSVESRARLAIVPMEALPVGWAEQMRAAVASEQFGALVLSGGSTARLVFDALGMADWEIGGSVTAGTPWGIASGMTVVTKSGAFGERDALVRILQLLGGEGK